MNRILTVPMLWLAVVVLCQLGSPDAACGQSEWVSRLDANNNGYIEPNEISDRARAYFDRFAAEYGINLSRPNSIERIESAIRRYNERRSDRDRESESIQPETSTKIKGFGLDAKSPLPQGFGVSNPKFAYTIEDVQEADQTLERYDRNRDGFIDRNEAERARWTESNPFEDDLNQDGLLSRMEMIQRYAKRRAKAAEPITSFSFRSQLASPGEAQSEEQRREQERANWRDRWRDRGSRELASNVIQRYDFNRNNLLDPAEITAAGFDVGKADYNRDGIVDREELSRWLSEEMNTLGDRMSDQLPVWFFERDLNNDRQLDMAEFTEVWDDQQAAEFDSYDLDGDGIITVEELLNSRSIAGGRFANQKANILLPRDSVISEIVVEEDFIIGDIDVQLSITHTYTEHLDGYLIAPDGTQVELFTGVGGSDDHFDRTIFDDDAAENIARSRPPFRGNFQPEAILKRQPGLNQFRGKNLKGVWQLLIRSSRSDRSGILHNWSMIVKPAAKSEYPSAPLGQSSSAVASPAQPSEALNPSRPSTGYSGRRPRD